MKSHLFLRGWLCAAALTASACISLSDLPLASDDGGELDATTEEPDAGEDQSPGPDGSTNRPPARTDASTPVDGSTYDLPDGDRVDASVDAFIEPSSDASVKSCVRSSDCAADEACDGTRCLPRCTSYGACVVHEAEQATRRLVSAGDAVYWVTGPSADTLGNPRKDAELWRLAPGGAAFCVLKNLGYLEPVIKDGYVYFMQGARLYRAPVQADAIAQPLYLTEGSSTSWTVGDSFLAFSSSRGIELGSLDGSAPQRTIAVELPADAPWIALTAGGDRIYFKRTSETKVWSVGVIEPFVIQKTPVEASLGTRSFVRGTVLYADCGPLGFPYLCGNDINDGSGFIAAKTSDDAFSSSGWRSSTAFVAGDWAYWGYSSGQPPRADLVRFSLVSTGVSQVLFAKDLQDAVMPGEAAAARDKFYFLPMSEDMAPSRLLYEMPLPPEPCSGNLPCANGKSCGSDALCH